MWKIIKKYLRLVFVFWCIIILNIFIYNLSVNNFDNIKDGKIVKIPCYYRTNIWENCYRQWPRYSSEIPKYETRTHTFPEYKYNYNILSSFFAIAWLIIWEISLIFYCFNIYYNFYDKKKLKEINKTIIFLYWWLFLILIIIFVILIFLLFLISLII